MFNLKIAFNNLSKNKALVVPYVITMSIFVGFFYNLLNLALDNQIKNLSGNKIIDNLIILGITVIGLIMLFYGKYANKFISDNRNRNMGILLMLGISKKEISLIVLYEKIILFLFNILGGLLLGISYNKFAYLLLEKICDSVKANVNYNYMSVIYTVIMLLIIYLIIYISEFNFIRNSSINAIFNSSSKGEHKVKYQALIAVLSLICLVVGYSIALYPHNLTTSFRSFILAVLFVIIGIFGIFFSTLIYLISCLKRNKKFYYNNKFFVMTAEMIHRLKENAFSLASICILSTITLISISVLGSLYIERNSIVSQISPRDLTIQSVTNVNKELDSLSKKASVTLCKKKELIVSQSVYANMNKNDIIVDKNGGVTSDYQLTCVSLNSFNKSNNTHYGLKKNEVLVYFQNKRNVPDDIYINHQKLKVKKQIKSLKFMFSPQRALMPNIFVITNNKNIAKKILLQNPRMIYMQGYTVNGSETCKNEFYNLINNNSNNFKYQGANVVTKKFSKVLVNSLFGGLLFIGIIFSIIFAILTIITIYYRQLSEGTKDQKEYIKLKKLGMSEDLIKKSIHIEMFWIFMLPLMFSILNLIVSSPILLKNMQIFGFNNNLIFIKTIIISIGIYIICYVLTYFLTSRIYQYKITKN
ncbi:FtsX-like permease family protein [Ligilactobacillus cholophilus]|uniref:FtsX-like permease family protein n=1 Tax=Ligilactobacillus cholophilus TaxID=3050131 RepID=UPI0025B17294|nr:FtsX-like permease family protein [Ligilactobacillus cholophilus]